MAQVRDIVVVGAAVGGITAIAKIAQEWPANSQTSVLIALKTPEQPAQMVLQIVAGYAPVETSYAVHQEALRPRHIYLSPPGKHLLVGQGGVLLLEAGGSFDSTKPSIDRLFASAAAAYGSRVIGIILSGDSKDGVQGMTDILKAGGATIVQDPDEAIDPVMPANIMRRDHPQYRVKAREIPSLVKRLLQEPPNPDSAA